MFVVNNTLASFKEYFTNRLENSYEKGEVEQLFNLTFFYFKGWDKISLRMNEKELLSESELLELRTIVKRLVAFEPIQHVFSKAEFFELEFFVNNSVLVPRQETEELVDLILSNTNSPKTLLDIGTGTGCIPIAIAKNNRQIIVSAIDVCSDAIEVAKKNANDNGVTLTLYCYDILKVSNLNEIIDHSIDIIVSNPPYITMKEKELMHENVLAFDPHLALFVENDSPLIFYDKISDLAFKKLTEGGELYFEINEYFGKETLELVKSYGFSKVTLIQDLNGKDRIVFAVK